uniref:Uncharacterized protein n=2 Tax=Tolypothrix TaxID=111782 RepID=A0A0C1RPF3_9CYAN
MTATDAYSAPRGWKFVKLTRDGLWGIVRHDTGELNEASRREWAQRWRLLRSDRLRQEKAHRAASLTEEERDRHIRDVLGQLQLSQKHELDLKHRGLSEELIVAGQFKSVQQWQKLDSEVSHRLAGVSLGGRSLITPQSGYLCPVWNPLGQIISWQLRVSNTEVDAPKYFWASSRTKKRPTGSTAHLSNGELPLTFCTPVIQNEYTLNQKASLFSSYIGLAEGILKPWIIAQKRNQITIGAAGGNFASSPETFKRYLTAASEKLGGTKDLLLWADAGAVINKNVMRQYRRTHELVRSWGYTLKVAWWGQVDKYCADGDEYTLEFEILNWMEFESLSRHPQRVWDDVQIQLAQIEKLLRPKRGFGRQVKRSISLKAPQEILVYTPEDLPTPEEYKRIGCPKIVYLGDERVSLWLEAIAKGWQHILDKSTPGLGKSHTAGSMTPQEFGSRQLWYLATDHRNPTTVTVEANFVDLPPRHSGLKSDRTRVTPLGQPFLVHPNGTEDIVAPGNCHRASTFRALAAKNLNQIEDYNNPICLSCHLLNACRHSTGEGFGYRFRRHSVLQQNQIRAHPDSLPNPNDYQYSDCGMIWDEASQLMRSRQKIEVHLGDFNRTAGELAVRAPELFAKLHPLFERLKFLFYSQESQKKALWEVSDIQLPSCSRYGYDDMAIHQLLGQPGDDITLLIDELARVLAPDLKFLARDADSIDTTAGTKSERATSRRINKLLRSTAYQESQQALEAVALNWLVPLLSVWGRQIRGALHFHKGILTLHLQETRHRDVANAAQFNIYLDATLDVRYLALKLGMGVEDVLVVEQVTPIHENLKVVQIANMGVLGRDRRSSMERRLEALRSEIETMSPGVAFIERKSFAREGDDYHFRDSRGVNRFANAPALCSIGIPYPNIGDLAAEYQVLTGHSVNFDLPRDFSKLGSSTTPSQPPCTLAPQHKSTSFDRCSEKSRLHPQQNQIITFEEFVDSFVRAEIIQEAGRLRSAQRAGEKRSHLRPLEQLVYYFVGDYDLEFLSEAMPGIVLEKISSVEVSPQAGTKNQRAIWLVSSLFSTLFQQGNKKPKQKEIENLSLLESEGGITQGRVSQIGKLFGGWSLFAKLITELLSNFLESHESDTTQFDEDERWIKDVYLPLLVRAGEIPKVEAIKEVIELVSVYGWQTFRQILKSVALDIQVKIFEYVASMIPEDILSIFVRLSQELHLDSS